MRNDISGGPDNEKAFACILSFCLLFSVPAYAETAALPFASVPDTPSGMNACSIEDFIFFMWDDWSEFDSERIIRAGKNKAYHLNPDDTDQILVCYIDGYNTDQYTPETLMASLLYVIIMSHTEADAAQPLYELIHLRDIEGIMISEEGTAMWMFQHGNAVVCVIIYNISLSASECRSKVLQFLGVTEDEIEVKREADTDIF